MDEIDRRVIQLYIEMLSTDTNFIFLWNELLTRDKHNIITPLLRTKYLQLLNQKSSNYDLNIKLYSDLQTRGKHAFGTLIQCLRQIHPALAELLLPTGSITTHQEASSEEFETAEGSLDEFGSAEESSGFKGYCMVVGDYEGKTIIANIVKKLCCTIKAKLISCLEDAEWNSEMTFQLIINVMKDELSEAEIGALKLPLSIKLIIINIEPLEMHSQSLIYNGAVPANNNMGNVFIANVYIHPGDHLPSVIYMIRKVIVNNPGYDIRDIFHLVIEKLAERGCKVNTESQSFPRFSFDPLT